MSGAVETSRVLIAGIGNVFLGDDGFGVEVARRLSRQSLPDGVRVGDYGIRGLHLAYELAGGGYTGAILVDVVPRGGAPGTLYAIEPEAGAAPAGEPAVDGHSVTPMAVLGLLRLIGGECRRIVIIGCEPASLEESMALSAPVAASVDAAVDMARRYAAILAGPGREPDRPCA